MQFSIFWTRPGKMLLNFRQSVTLSLSQAKPSRRRLWPPPPEARGDGGGAAVAAEVLPGQEEVARQDPLPAEPDGGRDGEEGATRQARQPQEGECSQLLSESQKKCTSLNYIGLRNVYLALETVQTLVSWYLVQTPDYLINALNCRNEGGHDRGHTVKCLLLVQSRLAKQ